MQINTTLQLASYVRLCLFAVAQKKGPFKYAVLVVPLGIAKRLKKFFKAKWDVVILPKNLEACYFCLYSKQEDTKEISNYARSNS